MTVFWCGRSHNFDFNYYFLGTQYNSCVPILGYDWDTVKSPRKLVICDLLESCLKKWDMWMGYEWDITKKMGYVGILFEDQSS
jgi:hypothetical protein